MQRKQMKETVYHGTIYEIDSIDLNKGRAYKDFGRGFYMSYLKKQAVGIMNKKYRTSKNQNKRKILYTFEIDIELCSTLNVKFFDEPDIEWLDFVLMCRQSADTCHNYDIVIGPTADDDTSFCLNMYFEGAYGQTDTEEAKNTLLRQLEVDNLGIQIFIGTEAGKCIIKSVKKEIIE